MRTLSRVISVLTVGTVIVFFALFVAIRVREKARQLEVMLPRIIAAELSDALDRKVTVEHFKLNRSDQTIEFRGVCICSRPHELGPNIATADRILIHYNPGFLSFRLFRPLDALGDIDIDRPSALVVHDRRGIWNVQQFGKPGPPSRKPSIPFTTTIHLVDGSVEFLDQSTPHRRSTALAGSARHIFATVLLQRGGPVRWSASGLGSTSSMTFGPPLLQHFSVDGIAAVESPNVGIHAQFDRAAIGEILEAYLNQDVVRLSDGIATGSVSIRLTPTNTGSVWSIDAAGNVDGIDADVRGLPYPIRKVGGTIALSDQTISFRVDQAYYGSARAAGSGILMGFHSPVLNGVFSFSGLTTSLLKSYFPPAVRAHFQLRGSVAGVAALQGPVTQPDVVARIGVDSAVVYGTSVGSPTLSVTYSEHRAAITSVSFRIAGGTVALAGTVGVTSAGVSYHLSGAAAGIDLAALPLPSALRRLRSTGLVTADLDVSGQGQQYDASARFSARNLNADINDSAYSAPETSGLIHVVSTQPGAEAVALEVRAVDLSKSGTSQRMHAGHAWMVADAHIGPTGLNGLRTQGAISNFTTNDMGLRSISWQMKPGPAGLSMVDIRVDDPVGDVQILGTASLSGADLRLQVLGRNLDVNSLSSILPALHQVRGYAFVNGEVTGNFTEPAFHGHVQVVGLGYRELTFERTRGDLAITSNSLRLSNVTLHIFPGTLVLNGRVALTHYAPGAIHLDATASDFSVTRIAALAHSSLETSGTAGAQVTISGTIQHPSIDGTLTVSNALVGKYAVGMATANFRYSPPITINQSAINTVPMLSGLEIRSAWAQSPDFTATVTEGRIQTDGTIHLIAHVTDLDTRRFGLPSWILPRQSPRITIDAGGNLNAPIITAQLPSIPVLINANEFNLSASDLVIRPNLPEIRAGHPLALLNGLSVGSLTLQRPGEKISIVGLDPNQPATLFPTISAAVDATGVQFSTLAGLFQKPLPPGVSGVVPHAHLSLTSTVRIPAEEAPPPGKLLDRLTAYLPDLKGAVSISLANIAVESAAAGPILPIPLPPGAYTQPKSSTTTPAKAAVLGDDSGPVGASVQKTNATITRGIKPAVYYATSTAGGDSLSHPTARKIPRSISSAPGTSAPTGALPSQPSKWPAESSGIHFDTGQFDARAEGGRIVIDTAYLNLTQTGASPLRLGLVSDPSNPNVIDLGGELSLTADLPGVPVPLISQMVSMLTLRKPGPGRPKEKATSLSEYLSRMSGEIFLTLRASGAIYNPTLTVSIDAAQIAPLTYGSTQFSIARMVATAKEGSITLISLVIGTRTRTANENQDHILRASGSLPFTWSPAPGGSYIPVDRKMNFRAGIADDNLSVLETLAPTIIQSAEGPFDAQLQISNTLAAPIVDGELTAGTEKHPGKITLYDVKAPIQNIVASIHFSGSQVSVIRFTGTTDRGSFEVTGGASLPAGDNPGNLGLHLTTKALHITDEGLVSELLQRASEPDISKRKAAYERVYGSLDSSLTIDGPYNRPNISGTVNLYDTSVRINALPTLAASVNEAPSVDPTFDIAIVFGREGKNGKDMSLSYTRSIFLKPFGTFALHGELSHPIFEGSAEVSHGGGFINYLIGVWKIDEGTVNVRYEPPFDPTENGLNLNMHAILTTQIEQPGTKAVDFFSSSGHVLNVTMDVSGDPTVPLGLHVLLSSDPPMAEEDLRALILHEQSLQTIAQGGVEQQLPGLFNELVRTSLIGNVLQPIQSKLADVLGLEEVNLEYQFGGPLFIQISKHWFDGVSARLRRELSASSIEYQFYMDYRLKGNLTFSLGILRRPTYTEQSLTLQSFLRF